MYIGVKSYEDAGRVHNYAAACAALERASLTPTGKRRTAKTYGFHLGANRNHGVTWVRRDHGDSIVFRLYSTDVVSWAPDDSVWIDNYGTVTTSAFAHQFLPAGFHLRHPVERRGASGGDCGIAYAPGDSTTWKDRRICFGDAVRFCPDGDGWAPDEATCDTIELPERAGTTRALAKRYHLRDFATWLPPAAAHLDIQHDSWDVDACAAALEHRDFRNAARFLPLITATSAFGIGDRLKVLPIKTRWRDQVITLGSLTKLRLALAVREGLFTTVSCKTIGRAEFDQRMALVREVEALGVAGYGWGAPQ